MIRIFFSLMMLLALSCSDVESLNADGDADPSSPLKIIATTASTTKGELINEAEDMESLGLYCALTGSDKWSTTTTFSKMEDRRFTISSDGDWQIDGDSESWGFTSFSDKYTFFSYSPYCDDTKGVTPYIKNGELFIDYITPINSKNQPDLMYAEPRKDIYAQVAKGVSLNFHHTLASIGFGVISETGETIDTIEITGVVREGTLSWDYELNLPTWSLEDLSTKTFNVEVDAYTPNSETSTPINTDRGYLMMIPQELTNGAQVTITLSSGEVETLTIPAGSVWEAGVNYEYIIRIEGEYKYFIFNSDQISNCYIINPTSNKATVVQIPIEDRINDFWENYSGKNSTKITTSSSTSDISVVMVWEDFDGSVTFDYDLIDDANEKKAVQLTFPADLQVGNFVFAVKEKTGENSYSTLWSWHLWFTDYNPDAIALANKDNIEAGVDKAYKLDGYEGAVHRYKDVGSSATVWSAIYSDKFIMDRNIGERNQYVANYGAGAVYYQFGRKDPFPGVGAWYSDIKSQPSVRVTSGADFYEGVVYSVDLIFSETSSSRNWSDETAARNYKYIWYDQDIPVDGYSEGKSIFDPSPLGWRIPVSDTWSSFNATGSTQSGSSDTKSVGVYNYYGCREPKDSGTLCDGGEVGYVWSANPLDYETGLSLYNSSSVVTSPYSLYVTYSLPIRAIQE